MKKLLFGLLMLSGLGAINAYSATSTKDALIAFKKMEKMQKDDWFDHMKSTVDARVDLLKKHHDQWWDFKIAALKSMPETGEMESHLKNELMHAIALHKAQKNEWRSYHNKVTADCEKLMRKHDNELASFEQKYELEGIEPEKPGILGAISTRFGF